MFGGHLGKAVSPAIAKRSRAQAQPKAPGRAVEELAVEAGQVEEEARCEREDGGVGGPGGGEDGGAARATRAEDQGEREGGRRSGEGREEGHLGGA